jgi:hypothetical protein
MACRSRISLLLWLSKQKGGFACKAVHTSDRPITREEEVKILIATAVAVSALALAGTASAQVYGNIGYSYLDGDSVNLGGPTAKIGWK